MKNFLIFSLFILSLAAACNDSDAENGILDERNTATTEPNTVVVQAQDNMNEVMESPDKTNLEIAEEFLAENKTKEGVLSTESGLQYMIMTDATGPKPGPTDKVKIHYHGTLLNGTIFDSSVDKGTPMIHPVNGFISGWTEALQLMSVGAKWKLFLHPDLAYGERGYPGSIPPNSALIFEVELLAINP